MAHLLFFLLEESLKKGENGTGRAPAEKSMQSFFATTCFSTFPALPICFRQGRRMYTFSCFRKHNTRLREILQVFLAICLRVLKLPLKRSNIVVGIFVENMET